MPVRHWRIQVWFCSIFWSWVLCGHQPGVNQLVTLENLAQAKLLWTCSDGLESYRSLQLKAHPWIAHFNFPLSPVLWHSVLLATPSLLPAWNLMISVAREWRVPDLGVQVSSTVLACPVLSGSPEVQSCSSSADLLLKLDIFIITYVCTSICPWSSDRASHA